MRVVLPLRETMCCFRIYTEKGGRGVTIWSRNPSRSTQITRTKKRLAYFTLAHKSQAKRRRTKKSSHEISLPQFRIEINFSLFFLELNPMTVYYPFGLDLLLLLLHLAWKFEKLSLRRKTKIREITGSVYGLSEFLWQGKNKANRAWQASRRNKGNGARLINRGRTNRCFPVQNSVFKRGGGKGGWIGYEVVLSQTLKFLSGYLLPKSLPSFGYQIVFWKLQDLIGHGHFGFSSYPTGKIHPTRNFDPKTAGKKKYK